MLVDMTSQAFSGSTLLASSQEDLGLTVQFSGFTHFLFMLFIRFWDIFRATESFIESR